MKLWPDKGIDGFRMDAFQFVAKDSTFELKTQQLHNIYHMNVSSFKESLSGKEPPQNSSVYLIALWYDAKGEWDEAHKLIQDIEDEKASWIHGYLHRKEGDIGNADYWYRRAGKRRSPASLEKEWEEIVAALI